MADVLIDNIFKDIVETIREPLLVLDSDLKVILASHSFYGIFKVKPEETVGQLIYDLGNKQWDIPKLRELLENILPEKTAFDNYEVGHDFTTIGRRIMLLNARQIEQVMGKERIILLAIEDITERKKIEAGLEKTRKELEVIKKSADEAHEFADSVINTVREPLISLDQDLRVVTVSRSFYDFFKVAPEDTVGQLIYDLGNKQWDIPKLRELLETILPQKTSFDGYEVEHDFPTIGRRTMLLNARQIEQVMGKERIILLAIEDITERVQAETMLKNSEEQYRRLFETADDGILLLEKSELKIRHANPAIISMLGYSIEELIGSDMKRIGFPDKLGTFQEILQTLIKDGIDHFENVVVQNKDGRAIYTDIYMTNRARLVQCNIRDISESKKAEASLKESEENYRILFDNAPDLIIVFNSKGNLLDLNKKFEEESGYSREEMIGKNVFTSGVLTEASVNMSMLYFEKILAEKKRVLFEVEGVTKDGIKISYELMAVPIKEKDGKIITVQATLRNITERKQSVKALQNSETHLRTLVQTIPDLIWLKDPQGIYLACNPRFESFFGAKEKDIIGKTDYDFIDRELADFFRENDKKAMEKGKPSINEEELVFAEDGHREIIETIKTPMYSNEGQLSGVLGIGRDITDRLNTQAQLIQAQKMESVGRLAGGVAHDYNNILGVIMGYTELTMSEIDSDGALYANLDEVYKAAKRGADITRQLLAFARKQTIAPIVLDLNERVEGILKMLRRLIGEDVNLVWSSGSNLWPIKIDPSQIDQILANLCVNARDAITGVGKITIETGIVVIDKAYCADKPGFVTGEFVMLAVSDNGCGMDKEILDNIFEPFFTTKPVDKGTGLGMSTVYGIVKQNKGFVNINSEPDEGSTIRIYLPRYRGKTVTIQEESIREIPIGHGEVVMLVEDDLGILKLGRRLLDSLGYTVFTANAPIKAMDLAMEHVGEIHLLVTDVIMPEMNGSDLAEQVRSLYPDIKVLFMSGYTSDTIARHGVLNENVNFIQKPFSKEDFAIAIRKALDGGKS